MSAQYDALLKQETTAEALTATCDFLTERLRLFLRRQEKVLVCFPDEGAASLGGIFSEAIRNCGGVPVFWGPDYRWKELLRLAFDIHAHTVIAHPLVVLGLMKLAKYTATPLYIYNVVLCGYPYARWMVEGIKRGLDCRIWGCYSVASSPVIVGFTCPCQAGIHVRHDLFDAVVLDEQGDPVPDPGRGRLYLISKKNPSLVFDPHETSILLHQPCSCGCDSPRIVETLDAGISNPAQAMIEKQILAWFSILDLRARRTSHGTDLELVVFPGEQLPPLPSCARLTIRPWQPERDVPFAVQDHFMKMPEKFTTES